MIFNFFPRRIGFRFALFHHHVDYIKLTKNGPFLQFIYEIRKTKIKKRINFQFSFFCLNCKIEWQKGTLTEEEGCGDEQDRCRER